MVDRIDAFAHVLPKPFYEEMQGVHPTEELHAIGNEPRFYDMDSRLDLFEEYNIDKQVITLARPPIWNGIAPEDVIEMTRVANDAVAAIAEEYPDQFIPVATLPLMDDRFVNEFDRCLDDLGMVGVQLFSNVEGQPIDGEAFEPVYERAASEDAPIWLHPQLHKWHEWDHEYMLHKILGWPFDTSLALARLVFGGVMERHPDLTVIPHHMGAMIPHFTNRIELFYKMLIEHPEVYPYPVQELETDIEEAFSVFYADTCRGGSSSLLEDGLSFFGEDNLVFATDYPFGPEEGEAFLREEIAGVNGMDIDEETRERIFGGNIESLLS